MTARLREDPAASGVCTAVGWYMTKHGVALLSGPDAPAREPVLDAHPQAAVDARPRREVADDGPVSATVEGYTALYDRDGSATMGIVSGIAADGRRTFGKTDAGAELVAGDSLGATAEFDGTGNVAL
jgi:acetyl-CoA C-acetyltransferase